MLVGWPEELGVNPVSHINIITKSAFASHPYTLLDVAWLCLITFVVVEKSREEVAFKSSLSIPVRPGQLMAGYSYSTGPPAKYIAYSGDKKYIVINIIIK